MSSFSHSIWSDDSGSPRSVCSHGDFEEGLQRVETPQVDESAIVCTVEQLITKAPQNHQQALKAGLLGLQSLSMSDFRALCAHDKVISLETIALLKQLIQLRQGTQGYFYFSLGPQLANRLQANYLQNNPSERGRNTGQVEPRFQHVSELESYYVLPLDKAKASIINELKQKENIEVFYPTSTQNVEDLKRFIKSELSSREGKAIGLILQSFQFGGWYVPENSNFSGHVIPYVLQKKDNALSVLVLDSSNLNGNIHFSLMEALRGLQDEGYTIQMIAFEANRQADHSSCHTDALEVLSGLLRRYQHQDIYQHLLRNYGIKKDTSFETEYEIDSDHDMRRQGGVFAYKARLPDDLHVVTQRDKSIVSLDKLSDTSVLHKSGKIESVSAHRDRYRACFSNTVNDSQAFRDFLKKRGYMNLFLFVKGYYNAIKVLNREQVGVVQQAE